MDAAEFVHWHVGDAWLGYLKEFPNYWTQGEDIDDLIEHLEDLHQDLTGSMASIVGLPS